MGSIYIYIYTYWGYNSLIILTFDPSCLGHQEVIPSRFLHLDVGVFTMRHRRCLGFPNAKIALFTVNF